LLLRTHQTTLRANVEGARAVVALARRCSRLRAVVHTSSAYVNINMPDGSVVQERIYPLMHGGCEVEAEEVVQVRGRVRQAVVSGVGRLQANRPPQLPQRGGGDTIGSGHGVGPCNQLPLAQHCGKVARHAAAACKHMLAKYMGRHA
jgi:hypothetical protein